MKIKLLIIGAASLVLVGILIASQVWQSPLPDGLTIVNGRIEGDPVVIAAKVPGRLIALHVREGDVVAVGQAIAEISSDQIVAKVDQAGAGRDAARATLEAAQANAEVAHNQLGRAEAAQAASVARLEKVKKDVQRAEQLFTEEVIPQAKLDDARATHDVAAAEVRAAVEQVASARRAIAAADAQAASAAQQVQGARATLDESRATFGDTQVQSPTRGVVMTKVAEQGEVLAAGAPIVVIVDLDALHMKAYVPDSPYAGLGRGAS